MANRMVQESELNGMSSSGEYVAGCQAAGEYLEKFQRIIARVRADRGGRPIHVVREDLLRAFDAEGLSVWHEVLEDAARRIVDMRQ